MKKYLFILVVFNSCVSFAQFTGGNGRGTAFNEAFSVSMAVVNTRYTGDAGDGMHLNSSNVLMGITTRYSGGNDDGSNSLLSNINLSSTQAGSAGGSGDGSHAASFNSVSLEAAVARFAGGNNDGITSVNSTLSLELSSRYSGGRDDGSHLNNNVAISMAPTGSQFSGGSGDGFHGVNSLSLSLNAVTRYAGGNDDGSSSSQAVFSYIFTGTGNWNILTNWSFYKIPPMSLPLNSEIIINPAGNTECILNVPQNILPGARITVSPGKKLTIIGSLIIQ